MALLITDTTDGNPQRMRCAAGRGARLQARAVFVGVKEGLWHS
jgi:hypothetical protein